MEWTSQSWQATGGERRPKPCHSFTIVDSTRIIKNLSTLTSLSRNQTLDTLGVFCSQKNDVISIWRAFSVDFDTINDPLALAYLLYPAFFSASTSFVYTCQSRSAAETTLAWVLPSDSLHISTLSSSKRLDGIETDKKTGRHEPQCHCWNIQSVFWRQIGFPFACQVPIFAINIFKWIRF